MTPMKVFQKKPMDKKSKIDKIFKKFNAFDKFCQNRYGKTKKNRELGDLTSGIKRDGHKKKSGN